MFRKERGFIPHLKKGAGFTLIELLIVIAVVGIMAAAILPRFIAFDTDASIAADQGSLGSMRAALALYRAKCGFYPEAVAGGGLHALTNTGGTGPYIEQIPVLQCTSYGDGLAAGRAVTCSDSLAASTGGWMYLSDTETVMINYLTGVCTTW